MITLYSPAPAWGLPSIVPASLKLEAWLRMAGISYEIAPPDLTLAPKGKLPFVRIDGELMGDSTLIIERLSREHGKDLDEGLSREERAVSLAFRRMVKEHLYWIIIADRWVSDESFAIYEPVLVELFFAQLPVEQQKAMSAMVRKGMVDQLFAQGMGKHRRDEIVHMGCTDLQAISDWLGQKPFFMGERPTVVDATLYGYLSNLIDVPLVSPVRDHGRATPNLLAYCHRIRDRFFPQFKA
jgi:glutathione S-transferase